MALLLLAPIWIPLVALASGLAKTGKTALEQLSDARDAFRALRQHYSSDSGSRAQP